MARRKKGLADETIFQILEEIDQEDDLDKEAAGDNDGLGELDWEWEEGQEEELISQDVNGAVTVQNLIFNISTGIQVTEESPSRYP